jgi:hypothetical protein
MLWTLNNKVYDLRWQVTINLVHDYDNYYMIIYTHAEGLNRFHENFAQQKAVNDYLMELKGWDLEQLSKATSVLLADTKSLCSM